MGGKSSTSTSSQQTTPENQPAVTGIANQIGQILQTPFTPYTGQLTAPVNSQQTAGINTINNAGTNAQNEIAQAEGMVDSAGQPLTAQQIAQYNNPYTQQVVQATENQFNLQNAAQQNQLKGSAAAAGALGGDRQAVAQAQLAGQQQTSEAPVIAGLEQSGYNQALQTAAQQFQQNPEAAAGLLGNLGLSGENAGLQEGQAQIGAGTLQQQTQQSQDTAELQQYLQQQGYPFQIAQLLGSLDLPAVLAEGQNSYGTQTTPGPSILSQLLGVAGLGIGLAGKVGTGGAAADGGVVRSPFAYGGMASPFAEHFAGGGMPYSTGLPYSGSDMSYMPNSGGQIGTTAALQPVTLQYGQQQQSPVSGLLGGYKTGTALSGLGTGLKNISSSIGTGLNNMFGDGSGAVSGLAMGGRVSGYANGGGPSLQISGLPYSGGFSYVPVGGPGTTAHLNPANLQFAKPPQQPSVEQLEKAGQGLAGLGSALKNTGSKITNGFDSIFNPASPVSDEDFVLPAGATGEARGGFINAVNSIHDTIHRARRRRRAAGGVVTNPFAYSVPHFADGGDTDDGQGGTVDGGQDGAVDEGMDYATLSNVPVYHGDDSQTQSSSDPRHPAYGSAPPMSAWPQGNDGSFLGYRHVTDPVAAAVSTDVNNLRHDYPTTTHAPSQAALDKAAADAAAANGDQTPAPPAPPATLGAAPNSMVPQNPFTYSSGNTASADNPLGVSGQGAPGTFAPYVPRAIPSVFDTGSAGTPDDVRFANAAALSPRIPGAYDATGLSALSGTAVPAPNQPDARTEKLQEQVRQDDTQYPNATTADPAAAKAAEDEKSGAAPSIGGGGGMGSPMQPSPMTAGRAITPNIDYSGLSAPAPARQLAPGEIPLPGGHSFQLPFFSNNQPVMQIPARQQAFADHEISRLVGNGWSVGDASAAVSSFLRESEGNPAAQGDRVRNADGSYTYTSSNIAQWHGPRQQQLRQFARDHGLDPNSLEAGEAFFDYETRAGGPFDHLRRAMAQTPNQADKGALWATGFEAPKAGPGDRGALSVQLARNYLAAHPDAVAGMPRLDTPTGTPMGGGSGGDGGAIWDGSPGNGGDPRQAIDSVGAGGAGAGPRAVAGGAGAGAVGSTGATGGGNDFANGIIGRAIGLSKPSDGPVRGGLFGLSDSTSDFLIHLGAGLLASTSPFPGVALGQAVIGAETNDQRQQVINIRAAQIAAATRQAAQGKWEVKDEITQDALGNQIHTQYAWNSSMPFQKFPLDYIPGQSGQPGGAGTGAGGGADAAASPVNPDGSLGTPNVSIQERMASLSAPDRNQIQAWIDARSPLPTSAQLRNKQVAAQYRTLMAMAPNVDFSDVKGRNKFATDYASSAPNTAGGQAKAGDTLFGNLIDLANDELALKNWGSIAGSEKFGSWANHLYNAYGSREALKNRIATEQEFASREINRLLVGGVGSAGEIDAVKRVLADPDWTPAQLASGLQSYRNGLLHRIDANVAGARDTMKQPWIDTHPEIMAYKKQADQLQTMIDRLDPDAPGARQRATQRKRVTRAALREAGAMPSGGAPLSGGAASAPATPTGASVADMTRVGGPAAVAAPAPSAAAASPGAGFPRPNQAQIRWISERSTDPDSIRRYDTKFGRGAAARDLGVR